MREGAIPALKAGLVVTALTVTSACGLLYHPTTVIGKETHREFLDRLSRTYGTDHSFWFIASHKSLVAFDRSEHSMQDQVRRYAIAEIEKVGTCPSEPVLDTGGSWFNERGDVYINFYCK
jgi:hypothetical protein